MEEILNPLFLSRIQFAFTVSFHIIFPSFTIGLASYLAVLEGLWLKTNKKVFLDLYKFWVKIFSVAFGMGVVSGVVLSYEIGTNWSVFSDKIANVIGPLLGFEVLTAFFLEASFLGIMLFGFNKVSRKMHFTATIIVAVGTLISAFWILSANSWMQTPTGFIMKEDGLLYPTNWLEIIFNPSFPYRLCHMITASYLTTSCCVAGVSAWYLLRNKFTEHAKIMMQMSMILIFLLAPIQMIIGDLHGLNTLKYQPAKVASMEGIWENEKGAALRIFAMPNQDLERNDYEVKIDKLASVILTHNQDGEVLGLKSFPRSERPPVSLVFWSFRIMVGIGILMIFTGFVALYLFLRKKLFLCNWFKYWCIFMSPLGFVAILAGWFVTEIGRQPYVVYGVLKTSDASSPLITSQVSFSLAIFIIAYLFIFGAGIHYIFKLVRKGIAEEKEEVYGDHGLQSIVTELIKS